MNWGKMGWRDFGSWWQGCRVADVVKYGGSLIFPCSSMVERFAVNEEDEGSNPSGAAGHSPVSHADKCMFHCGSVGNEWSFGSVA